MPILLMYLEMLDNLTFEESSGQIRTNYDRKFEFLEEKDSSNFAVSNWKSFKNFQLKQQAAYLEH